MKTKSPYIIGGSILLFLFGFLLFGNQKIYQSQNNNSGLSVPSLIAANTPSSQDPQDIVPGLYKNPIQNTSTQEGIVIQSVTVENNIDETGKAIGDHLELALKNNAGKDLTDFEVYYTISDPTTNKKEGYYKKLTGFILKNGAVQTINFDNKQGLGHFTSNQNSIYYTSSNKLLFDVIVSAPGYKTQTIQVTKAAGGAETKD